MSVLPATLSASALLLTGAAGSVHCALMCGALSVQAAGRAPGRRGWHNLLALHGGRVLGYALLGAAAGTLGARLLPMLPPAGEGRWLQGLAALLLIAIGLRQYLRLRKPEACCLKPPATARARGTLGLLGAGLAWTLTPCPFKYSMLMLAGLAGHAASGALLMGAFAFGSSPLLLLAAALLRLPTHSQRAAQLSAISMLALGALTLAALFGLPGFSAWAWCSLPPR